MAQDIKLIWNDEYKEGDIQFTDGDLVREEGLETAVLLSLFLDRRAREDDKIDDPLDPRGWWADQLEDDDQIGSRLWLLERASTTSNNIKLAGEYIKEALQWMIDDGVAKKIEVVTERIGSIQRPILAFQIKIHKVDGTDETFKYSAPWEAQMTQ